MITPLPRFLRRAGAPRSVQSQPEKTRLTVQFVNLSTRPMWPEFILSDVEGLETCFALRAWVRSPTQVGPWRLRFSVQTVNFTFHNRPPPTSQRALEKPESRVQTVNFTIGNPLSASTSFGSLTPKFRVSFVNFTIVGDLLMAMLSRLEALQLRVWFVNFTFHNWLCPLILTA